MLYSKPAEVTPIEHGARAARLRRYEPTAKFGYEAEAVALRWVEKYRFFARKESLTKHPDHAGMRGINRKSAIDTTKLDAAVWERFEEVLAEIGKDKDGNPDVAKRNFLNQFRERIFDVAYGSLRRGRETPDVEFVKPFHELSNAEQFHVVKMLAEQAYDFARDMQYRGCNIHYTTMARNSPVVYCDPRHLNEYYRHLVGTSLEKLNKIRNAFFNAPRKMGQEAQLHKIETKGVANHPLSGNMTPVSQASPPARPQFGVIDGGLSTSPLPER